MSLRTGFPGEGGPLTLTNFVTVYSAPSTYKILLNTLLFAFGTVIVGLAFAVPLVWLLNRTDIPLKNTIYVLMTVGILIPVFLRTIAWILLLSPRIGLVNQWAMQLFNLDQPIISLYNIPGMAFVQGVSFVPSAFFMPFLQAIKPTLRALAGLGSYGMRRELGVPKLDPATGSAADLKGENLNRLLERHGIALPKQAMAGTAADAAAKAKEVGFPVAIKLIAAEVVHKTESGAVVLGVKNAEEAQAEGQKLLTKTLGRGHLLIQEMVHDENFCHL